MKKIFITIFFIGCSFLAFHQAKAATLIQQDSYDQAGLVSDEIINNYNGYDFGLSGGGKVGSVKVYLGMSNDYYLQHSQHTCIVNVGIQDTNGNEYGSYNPIYFDDLPLGHVEPFTFNFTATTTINFQFQKLELVIISTSGYTHSDQYGNLNGCNYNFGGLIVGYSDSDHYDGTNSYLNPGGTNDDLAFDVYDQNGAVPPLAITSPTNGSQIAAGNYTFSGTCKNIGSNVLGLTRDVLGEGGLNADPPQIDFNIACDNTYHWSAAISVTLYDQFMYIVDSTDGSFSTVDFTVSNQSQNYLQIIYPTDDGSHNVSIQPDSNATLRFKYTYDPSLRTSTGNGAVGIKTTPCTDNTYSDTSCDNNSATTQALADIDGNNTGYFTESYSITDGQIIYKKMQLETSSSTLYTLNFSLTGSSTSTNASTPPDLRDVGYCIKLLDFCPGNMIRDLFIPPYGYWDGTVNSVSSVIREKVPFAYFYQLKDTYDSFVTATNTNYSITFPLTLATSTQQSTGFTTYQMHFLDSTNTQQKGVFDQIRPWIQTFLWLSFGWYLVTRALSVFRPV